MGEAFTTAIGAVWDGITNFATTIKGEPILMLPVGLSFVGSIIGIGKGFFTFGRRKK